MKWLSCVFAVYQLNSGDVFQLRRDGVSKEIVDYLLATPSMFGVRHHPYSYDPYYPYYYDYPPVIIAEPYRHHWRHW